MKSKVKKNIIAGGIFLIVFITLSVIGEINSKYKRDNGVFVILKTDKYLRGTYYGKLFTYNYDYNNRRYNSDEVLDFKDTVGVRYFIQVLPDDPTRKLIYRKVPSWFTLDSPPEGWKTMPTETEMREMMTQNSIKRGLN